MTTSPLAQHVNTVVLAEVTRINELSAGASAAYPHAGLLATVDTQRNRYVAAASAQVALSRVDLRGREGSLLDATTLEELTLAADVLAGVRAAVMCTLGEAAGVPIWEMRKAVLSMVEAARAS